MSTKPVLARTLPGTVVAVFAGGLLACGSPARNVPVEVPDAVAPTARQQVEREVGRLLRPEPDVSREAERRLLALDAQALAELRRLSESMPTERDPRWLHVLDENGLLPALTPEERIDFLLWKAARSEPFYASKAQSGLADLARSDPDRLIARVRTLFSRPVSERTARDAESIGTALAVAKVERAVPALVDAYVAARDVAERRALAEVLAILAGEARRPRVTGLPQDIAKDAERIRQWWQARGGTSGG